MLRKKNEFIYIYFTYENFFCEILNYFPNIFRKKYLYKFLFLKNKILMKAIENFTTFRRLIM